MSFWTSTVTKMTEADFGASLYPRKGIESNACGGGNNVDTNSPFQRLNLLRKFSCDDLHLLRKCSSGDGLNSVDTLLFFDFEWAFPLDAPLFVDPDRKILHFLQSGLRQTWHWKKGLAI